jgi:hypothetical protein
MNEIYRVFGLTLILPVILTASLEPAFGESADADEKIAPRIPEVVIIGSSNRIQTQDVTPGVSAAYPRI